MEIENTRARNCIETKNPSGVLKSLRFPFVEFFKQSFIHGIYLVRDE